MQSMNRGDKYGWYRLVLIVVSSSHLKWKIWCSVIVKPNPTRKLLQDRRSAKIAGVVTPIANFWINWSEEVEFLQFIILIIE